MKKILISFFSFLFLFGFASSANAATLFFVPETKTSSIGEEFFVDVKVATEDAFINAAQVSVTFPKNILEVSSLDKTNSIFNFWVEDPSFSNSNGVINFVGGTSKGVSGSSLQILRIKFKVVGSGSGELNMVESVVTANDGKGTNVLSQIRKASIIVRPSVSGSSGVSVINEPIKVTEIEVPRKVERVPVEATNLPKQPKLRVPLYSDSSKWYNYDEEAIVFWDIPDDVVKVAVSVNSVPKSVPMKAEDELFTGKKLGVLGEGVNYIHVQFRNNQGWGDVAHYRVAIDTTPPIPFDILIDSKLSDNPTPKIEFEGADSLSGFAEAFMSIDGGGRIPLKETSFKLPIQKPGVHRISINVFDKAGNSAESLLDFEIIPLETPVIDFVTEKISQGEPFFMSGISSQGEFVDIEILNEKGELAIPKQEIVVDNSRSWRLFIDQGLKKGDYKVSVVARDSRGATSYSTNVIDLKITERIILSVGFIDLGWVEIFIFFVLLIVAFLGFIYWYYNKEEERKFAYKMIAGRDVIKVANLLLSDLEKIESLHGQRSTPKTKIEFNDHLSEMRDNIEKMKRYLGQGIGKL